MTFLSTAFTSEQELALESIYDSARRQRNFEQRRKSNRATLSLAQHDVLQWFHARSKAPQSVHLYELDCSPSSGNMPSRSSRSERNDGQSAVRTMSLSRPTPLRTHGFSPYNRPPINTLAAIKVKEQTLEGRTESVASFLEEMSEAEERAKARVMFRSQLNQTGE